jgi:hypothetical protein
MKWLLVAIVMHTPVKTDLVFDSLPACLTKESEMRQAWVDVINKTIAWQESTNMSKDDREKNRTFVMEQMTSGTCIPTK